LVIGLSFAPKAEMQLPQTDAAATRSSPSAALRAASALFPSPKQAKAIPARPAPNRFGACRRNNSH
jgi:hypothetical protein